MATSITAEKSVPRKAVINFNSEAIIAEQMDALRKISIGEPMSGETRVLLNLIMDMVTDQRLIATTVIPQPNLTVKLMAVRAKMELINKISNKVKDILPN